MTELIESPRAHELRNALTERLARLEEQRVQAEIECLPAACGDYADRTFNVEACIRLEDLERRIEEVSVLLQQPVTAPIESTADPAVAVGSIISIRFGQEKDTETYLVDYIDRATSAPGVITPNSPLGHVLLGAHVGEQVTYKTVRGGQESARVVEILTAS